MTGRIDVAGPLGSGIAAVVAGLLEKARKMLAEPSGDIHEAVHDARKNFKAVRSHLRLVRPAIGDSYSSLNGRVRDAARRLAEARDSQALHDAINLVERRLGSCSATTIAGLRAAADAEVGEAASDDAVRRAAGEVKAEIALCLDEMANWKLPEDDLSPYLEGLHATYRRARRDLGRGLSTGLAQELHEARKRVIHWRYQLDLLSGIWPRPMRAEVRELQDLRETLGQHNDLVMLQQRIEAGAGGFAGLPGDEQVLDAVIVLRARRVREAARHSRLLFGETPSRKIGRISLWWDVARNGR